MPHARVPGNGERPLLPGEALRLLLDGFRGSRRFPRGWTVHHWAVLVFLVGHLPHPFPKADTIALVLGIRKVKLYAVLADLERWGAIRRHRDQIVGHRREAGGKDPPNYEITAESLGALPREVDDPRVRQQARGGRAKALRDRRENAEILPPSVCRGKHMVTGLVCPGERIRDQRED